MTAIEAAQQIRSEKPEYFHRATVNQLATWAAKLDCDHRELVAAVRVLRSTGRPSGEDLARQQEVSRAAAEQAAKERRKEQARQARAANEAQVVADLHADLLAAGFALTAQSESESRYYQRGGEVLRISDHAPNDATQAWLDSVGGRWIDTLGRNPRAALAALLAPEEE